MSEQRLDVICLGRSSVDLYGEQVGGRLEDVQTFAKYVGGCPTNISVGTARLGLKSALITRVGDEQMGRFIVETLNKEGVDTSQITSDPERLTALVILAIRDRQTFPHIFYRPDCADMALSDEHIDAAFISSSRALLVTGTHFSQPGVEKASRKAIACAKAGGTKVVLDIDYRPVLWGLTGHAAGENRFVADPVITERLRSILADCDLVVGTEEEIHIAGGTRNTLDAVRNIRSHSTAVIVVKRGPMGCVVYDGDIPNELEHGLVCRGREIEVYNTLGAGDGFMSGFLRGWLRDESLGRCAEIANGVGALVVSRHGCAPAMPSWIELEAFLANADIGYRPRENALLNRLHRVTSRSREWPEVLALAFDHRKQFEDLACDAKAEAERISEFKELVAEAATRVNGDTGAGAMIIDGRYGSDILSKLTGSGHWLARPVESPGSNPLEFDEGPDIGLTLRTWPREHVAKCLVFYHPDDHKELRERQTERLRQLYAACVQTERELLLEVIPPRDKARGAMTIGRALAQIYDQGIYPDWWKLPPAESAEEWSSIGAAIDNYDPHCRGVILLGLNAPVGELSQGFDAAANQPWCKGFAVGRSIFQQPAEAWFSGEIDDEAAINLISKNYHKLINLWRDARSKGPNS